MEASFEQWWIEDKGVLANSLLLYQRRKLLFHCETLSLCLTAWQSACRSVFTVFYLLVMPWSRQASADKHFSQMMPKINPDNSRAAQTFIFYLFVKLVKQQSVVSGCCQWLLYLSMPLFYMLLSRKQNKRQWVLELRPFNEYWNLDSN